VKDVIQWLAPDVLKYANGETRYAVACARSNGNVIGLSVRLCGSRNVNVRMLYGDLQGN
jgi:hypothetical protein